MPAKAEELFNNKIRLIYEYNRKSPFFARIACWELENNNIDTAIEILESGLRENPDFPTPYFLLGKCFSKKGEYIKAAKYFKRGSELINSKETYQFYLQELETLKNLNTGSQFHSEKILEEKKEKNFGKEVSSVEDNLDYLAEKISHARIPVINEEKISESFESAESSESSLIVSETLAKIYIAQGEIQEAISIYEKLKKKNPANENYFSQKIAELKSKL